MKTMTCAQLGGPCDQPHRGEDANAVINAQDQHLKEREAAGDATHQEAPMADDRDRNDPYRKAGQPQYAQGDGRLPTSRRRDRWCGAP